MGKKGICVISGVVFSFSRSFVKVSFLCSFLVCVFSFYLTSQLIFKLTLIVWEKDPQQQVCVAYTMFRFSAQFKSGAEYSDKPKAPKFISQILFEPLLKLHNHFFFFKSSSKTTSYFSQCVCEIMYTYIYIAMFKKNPCEGNMNTCKF